METVGAERDGWTEKKAEAELRERLVPREVPRVAQAFTDDRARLVFLTLTLTGLRREELRGLRCRHVNLVEGVLRVDESRSEEGERSIALPSTLAAAGIEGRVRTFHDKRHTALTNLAATGASPIAVMTTAGHRSMQTTKQYLHLAGVVFRDDAAALERRL